MTDTGERSAAGSIGVFDSGVGGLSVAREIRGTLPAEDLLYVADTAYCPYGDRPLEEVRARALAVGRYLQDAGAKLVVAACNTATGAALEDLRAALSIPVVGRERGVRTAVARRRGRRPARAHDGRSREGGCGRTAALGAAGRPGVGAHLSPGAPREGGQAASWKMMPRANRVPAHTRLTPCRTFVR